MEKDKALYELADFLEREAPPHGGCMVCRVTRKERKEPEFLLVERVQYASGGSFTINHRMFYDYDFVWRENPDWEILWKYEGSPSD